MSLLNGFPDLANLDNKKYDEIVTEARSLIARYSKEWTDHNVSDPGITFIELFAWLAEMQIYQLNRVTENNYKKFLKLMGFYPLDAQPGRVDITFQNMAEEFLFNWDDISFDESSKLRKFLRDNLNFDWVKNAEIKKIDNRTIRVFNNKNSVEILLDEVMEKAILKISDTRAYSLQVKKENGKLKVYNYTIFTGTPIVTKIGAEEIEFETEEDLTFIKANLKSIKTTTDSQTIDNTDANEKENIYFAAFGKTPSKEATLRLGFDKPLQEKDIKITFILFEKDLPPPGNHADEVLQITPSAKVVWEYKDGEKWNEISIKKDTTLALNRSGRVVFDGPFDGYSKTIKENDLYWIRCRLKEGSYEIAPRINKILLNTISAVQVETINEDFNGFGVPEQKIQLKNKPVQNRYAFSTSDILDWSGLLNKFKKQDDYGELNPEKHIFNMFDPEIQALIGKWNGIQEPDDALKYEFIKSLNKVLESRDLYEFDSFKGIKRDDLPGKFLIYLFCWDEIHRVPPGKDPGNDTIRLMEFLIKNYNANWIRIAKIDKSADVIKISDDKNSLSLKLNNEKTKVTLNINEVIFIDEFDVKKENGKKNIYALARKIEFNSDAEVRTLNRFLIEVAYPDDVAKHSIIVQTQKKDGKCENWYEVDDFESSGPEDTHYIFDPEKNEIMFGNGLNSRMVLESEIIRVIYKTTLGQKGNILKGQEWTDKEKKIKGENKKEATGGKDAESLEHAKARARKDCRTIYRAITLQDFEFLALHTPGLRVSRAKALPNYSPEHPCIKMPDAVTVVVVPHSREGSISIGKGFRQTVLRHLDMHRLVTTDIYIVPPKYVKISVNCKVHINKGSSPEEVKKRVQEKLKKFLNEGPDGKGWPFGRAVYPSEIYQIIDKTEGVDYATNVSLNSEEQYKKGNIIEIPPVALVYLGEHRVEII